MIIFFLFFLTTNIVTPLLKTVLIRVQNMYVFHADIGNNQ